MSVLMGVKLSTYGNVESAGHRVVRRDRIERVLEAPELAVSPEMRARVLAAFDSAPASPFAEKMRDVWARRNEQRARARKALPLERALVRVLVDRWDCGAPCTCAAVQVVADLEIPAFVCELCEAVRALGLADEWTAEIGDALDRRLSAITPSTDLPTPVDNENDAGADFG